MYEGLEDLRERAEAGDVEACIELGDILLKRAPYAPTPVEADPSLRDLYWNLRFSNMKAAECPGGGSEEWDQRAREGRQEIARRIEEIRRRDPLRTEFVRAATRYFEIAAKSGDPEGLWRLGWRYLLGEAEGVFLDENAAYSRWQQAVRRGHRPSMRELANRHQHVPLLPDAGSRLATALNSVAELHAERIQSDSKKLVMLELRDLFAEDDLDLRRNFAIDLVLVPVESTVGKPVRLAKRKELRRGFVQLDSGLVVPGKVAHVANLPGLEYTRKPRTELYWPVADPTRPGPLDLALRASYDWRPGLGVRVEPSG